MVRNRDLACRATGNQVPKRERGYDFVGFEFAHVFPFGNLGDDVSIQPFGSNTIHETH